MKKNTRNNWTISVTYWVISETETESQGVASDKHAARHQRQLNNQYDVQGDIRDRKKSQGNISDKSVTDCQSDRRTERHQRQLDNQGDIQSHIRDRNKVTRCHHAVTDYQSARHTERHQRQLGNQCDIQADRHEGKKVCTVAPTFTAV